jgi:hypothetical protein
MCRCVNHPWHHDAAGGVDLYGAFRDAQRRADLIDQLPDHQHVGPIEDGALTVDGQHRAVPEYHRSSR